MCKVLGTFLSRFSSLGGLPCSCSAAFFKRGSELQKCDFFGRLEMTSCTALQFLRESFMTIFHIFPKGPYLIFHIESASLREFKMLTRLCVGPILKGLESCPGHCSSRGCILQRSQQETESLSSLFLTLQSVSSSEHWHLHSGQPVTLVLELIIELMSSQWIQSQNFKQAPTV